MGRVWGLALLGDLQPSKRCLTLTPRWHWCEPEHPHWAYNQQICSATASLVRTPPEQMSSVSVYSVHASSLERALTFEEFHAAPVMTLFFLIL